MEDCEYYKQRISFGDEETYYDFIGKQVKKVKPHFLSINKYEKINTPHGIMYAVSLSPEIENRNNEVCALCVVNNQHFVWWGQSLYAVASDKNGILAAGIETNKIFRSVIIYKVSDLINV